MCLHIGAILQFTHTYWIASPFSSLHSPWDNFIMVISLMGSLFYSLLISHNYNIENADDSFDIHKNAVLISMLITRSTKPDA